MKPHYYICIDLKSFYASVECVDRGLDPLDTCLVVADKSRSDRTICLAVSPPLKKRGVPGRPRLFEVIRKVDEINALRRSKAPQRSFRGMSHFDSQLRRHPEKALSYIVAMPRMQRYIEMSRDIYGIYLRYIAPQDIHVYSIDEVMIDATPYLSTYGMTPYTLAMTMIRDVLQKTGITATGGIGTNLYLSKVAMDIVAKALRPDPYGVRIAFLDETSYRRTLWGHQPLTDFWRIGPGSARRLSAHGLYTMGDIARLSLSDASLLYDWFGINAELLIDHAWGWESCRMSDIKRYIPKASSLGTSQVLPKPYSPENARMIAWEMTDELILDLARKRLVTDEVALTIGYDGRQPQGLSRDLPPSGRSHGSARLAGWTHAGQPIMASMMALYDRMAHPYLWVRRMSVTAVHVRSQDIQDPVEEVSLFAEQTPRLDEDPREARLQEAALEVHHRFGRNALVKGRNLCKEAMTITRHGQIGGHHA
ncbi:MAG: DNA methylase [Acidaminococcus sp.]|nr:DNA methylase [Acidaminococcus sp.]MDY2739315.1 DNA methylase [Acidaminococcus sp.]